MAKKTMFYWLLVVATFVADPAQAVMNGQGQDVVPVPAVFQSSATVYYSNPDNAGVTVSSGLVVAAGSVNFGGTGNLIFGGPSVQTVTDDETILPNGIYKKVDTTGAANATLTASPSVLAGIEGQLIVVVNKDASDSIIINNATGVVFKGTTLTLAPGEAGMFVFSGSSWQLLGTSGTIAP